LLLPLVWGNNIFSQLLLSALHNIAVITASAVTPIDGQHLYTWARLHQHVLLLLLLLLNCCFAAAATSHHAGSPLPS
jgi:hypothetical protein